jgi:phosphoserine phosphatase RsbU/P
MSKEKILIVDDEPFNVDYLEQELDELNYETVNARNGQEALDQVWAEHPNLVLLDIMMPVMDGFEVLRHLKADPATCDIPVIVISANSDLGSVVRGIELGAEDYLPKPFEPALLQVRISTSLEKKRLHDIEQLYIKSLEREMNIARDIQKEFLPSGLPNVNGWAIEVYFKAAREVAGDFYDAFFLPDGNLMFVVGDVCGKGVGAALFMTLFRSLLRASSTTDVFWGADGPNAPSLQEHLLTAATFTNSYINDTHGDTSIFATVFIGAFDIQTGLLTYINCGNEPALILRNGQVFLELRPTGPVIGIIPDARFKVKEFVLEKNDLILTFTDGIPDARNIDGESFGRQGLLKVLDGIGNDAGLVLKKIEEGLRSFIGTNEQFDDITLMVVKRDS